MRLFELHRAQDDGGVSGTGVVAEGVVFSNGKCALSWKTQYTSVAIYDDIETLETIHGHGGKTRVVFHQNEESAQPVCHMCKGTGYADLRTPEGNFVTPCPECT